MITLNQNIHIVNTSDWDYKCTPYIYSSFPSCFACFIIFSWSWCQYRNQRSDTPGSICATCPLKLKVYLRLALKLDMELTQSVTQCFQLKECLCSRCLFAEYRILINTLYISFASLLVRQVLLITSGTLPETVLRILLLLTGHLQFDFWLCFLNIFFNLHGSLLHWTQLEPVGGQCGGFWLTWNTALKAYYVAIDLRPTLHAVHADNSAVQNGELKAMHCREGPKLQSCSSRRLSMIIQWFATFFFSSFLVRTWVCTILSSHPLAAVSKVLQRPGACCKANSSSRRNTYAKNSELNLWPQPKR